MTESMNKSRGNMVPQLIKMPLASSGLIAGCSRDRWENCRVNAVEELRPAKTDVNKIPASRRQF